MDNIIVTGAAGGIGGAVVRELLESGRSVWAVGRSMDKLKELYGERGNCRVYSCDLAREEEIDRMFADILAESGPIGGLVHCAGTDRLSPLYLNKRAKIQELFDIHVFAAMQMCKLLCKKSNAAEGCSVVLISSLSAHEGAAGHTAYAAAKGALEGFLPSAASELAERGIRINEVVPGVVRTEMSDGFISRMDSGQREALERSYPLGIGEPEDVAHMICFLLSSEAKWLTGQKYILDGGHMVRKSAE